MTIYELITKNENTALSTKELAKQLYPEYQKYFNGSLKSLNRKIRELRSLSKVEPVESIEKVSKQQRQIVKLGQTNSEKDRLIKYQHSLIEQYEKKIEVWEALQNYNPESYIIKPENKNISESHPIICISDVHYEKNIDKDVVNGLNHYNREIAKLRLSTAFQRGLKITKMYNQDVKIKDLTLVFGGDLIDGHLRDENLEENSLSPIEALMELTGVLKNGIDYLLNNCVYKIRIICLHGNHPRDTDKIQHANFYKHSYEWILYHQLKSYYDDKRIEFMIEKSYLSYIDIYDKVVRLQHGNNIKFGGGIGGLTIPIIKAIHNWNSSKRATFDIIHDKHRWIPSDIFCVNGSVCGYDAFAGAIKAEYQKPIQTHLMFNSNPNWRYPINTPIYLETEEEKKFWD